MGERQEDNTTSQVTREEGTKEGLDWLHRHPALSSRDDEAPPCRRA